MKIIIYIMILKKRGRKPKGESWRPYIDDHHVKAIRLLAREAQRQGRTMASVADELGRALSNFSVSLCAKRIRPTFIAAFARVLKLPELVIRALIEDISPGDESQIGQRVMFFLTARRELFIPELKFEVFQLISQQSIACRRKMLARFFLAEQGLDVADPLNILAEELNIQLDSFRTPDLQNKHRLAYAGLILIRRMLGITLQDWESLEKILDPYMDSYIAWRAHQKGQVSMAPLNKQIDEINQRLDSRKSQIVKTPAMAIEWEADIKQDLATRNLLIDEIVKKSCDPNLSFAKAQRENDFIEKIIKAFSTTYQNLPKGE